MMRTTLVVGWVVFQGSLWGAQTAIPEPPIVFYGRLPAGGGVERDVRYTLTANGSPVTADLPSRTIDIDGIRHYVVQIPFETRRVVGAQDLAATPNVLELTREDTIYKLVATVDGELVAIPDGLDTLVYGVFRQGVIRRIDLDGRVSEPFEDWAERTLGDRGADPDGDADGDGDSNRDEWVAGTDPADPDSRTEPIEFAPTLEGGITIRWESVVGKRYTLVRSATGRDGDWSPVVDAVPGTGQIMLYQEGAASPDTPKRLFFQLRVWDPLL